MSHAGFKINNLFPKCPNVQNLLPLCLFWSLGLLLYNKLNCNAAYHSTTYLIIRQYCTLNLHIFTTAGTALPFYIFRLPDFFWHIDTVLMVPLQAMITLYHSSFFRKPAEAIYCKCLLLTWFLDPRLSVHWGKLWNDTRTETFEQVAFEQMLWVDHLCGIHFGTKWCCKCHSK